MKILYSVGVFLYNRLVCLAALFNTKAKLRTRAVRSTFELLKSFSAEKLIWFHCASLGEFEQGRPLIEKIKSSRPDYKIALSFFSPSGFEVQKDYQFADLVFYLPGDSKKNAKQVIALLKPNYVFFVKYEFWYWYIQELGKQNIPLYLVSGIFRRNQVFFKFYGSFFRKILKNFEYLFVQNQSSFDLLQEFGIKNAKITGDTRFDRVAEIASQRKRFELIDTFAKDCLVFIAGSTWKPDEEIIADFINRSQYDNTKYIIVPHEINKAHISHIKGLFKESVCLYTEAKQEELKDASVLIIDTIGMLSSVYAYADLAYIGGGFGAGIHNTLEAAVYGIPVIFGPKYQKFDEAKELIKRKAGFSVSDKNSFSKIMEQMLNEANIRMQYGKNAETFVNENIGASDKVLAEVKL